MKFWKTAALGTAITAIAGVAAANCPTSGRLSIIGNEFAAIQTVGADATSCADSGLEAKANLTADHQKINVAGMTQKTMTSMVQKAPTC